MCWGHLTQSPKEFWCREEEASLSWRSHQDGLFWHLWVSGTFPVMSWPCFSVAHSMLVSWWLELTFVWHLLDFPRISSRPVSRSSLRTSVFHGHISPWRQKPWTCSISSRSRSRSHSSDQWVETLAVRFSVGFHIQILSLKTKYGHWNPGHFSITVTDEWNSVTDFAPSWANWYTRYRW